MGRKMVKIHCHEIKKLLFSSLTVTMYFITSSRFANQNSSFFILSSLFMNGNIFG